MVITAATCQNWAVLFQFGSKPCISDAIVLCKHANNYVCSNNRRVMVPSEVRRMWYAAASVVSICYLKRGRHIIMSGVPRPKAVCKPVRTSLKTVLLQSKKVCSFVDF